MSQQEPTPAPSQDVRLAWWFAIFLSGFVSILVRVSDQEYSPFAVIFFPVVLGFILIPLVTLLPEALGPYLMVLVWPAGIAFYIWHFYATFHAPTRKKFNLLLLLLVAVVILNQLVYWGMGRVSQ